MARAPVTWPLLRGFSHRFWQAQARHWDQRVSRSGPDHLAPLAAALLHVRPEPERALDIGTGLGDGALLIAREFPHARVRGVDLSEEMIRRAQGRIGLDPEGRVAFKVADASHLPFEDDSFDLVAQLNMPPFFAEIAPRPAPGRVRRRSRPVGGPAPPSTRPTRCLRAASARRGLETLEAGEAAKGTYFVAHRPPDGRRN